MSRTLPSRPPVSQYSNLDVPRGAVRLRASSFGIKSACLVSRISDTMRLEALAADNISGASANSSTITGLALPYENLSTGQPAELYARGAFTRNLRENPDQKVLFQFNMGHVLGSSKAGTCRVWEEHDGLHFECIAPDTSWARDLLVSIKRGDVDESGAIAIPTVSRPEIRNGARCRVITQANLFLVSVCSFSEFDSSATVKQNAAAAQRVSRLPGGVYGSRV